MSGTKRTGSDDKDDRLAAAVAALSAAFGSRCSLGDSVRDQHASTLTDLPHQKPDCVVWPETAEEVAAIVAIARRCRIPLIPFGAGTSLEGQVNAPFGGVSVDLTRMNRILRIGAEDLDVTVEAGVTIDQLNDALRHTGLFFPVDPGAGTATLGGMASTRASGTTTVRYGAMRENVLALKVVLATGEVISTGSRARKSAAGYDLTRLFVGAEGTLGLIVELTLRLAPRPETMLAVVTVFPSIAAAAEATIAAIQSGLTASRIELLDPLMLQTFNAQSGTALPTDGPALFVEIGGTAKAAQEHLALYQDIADAHGGRSIAAAAGEDDRRRVWKARHDAFWSVRSAWPGKAYVVTDICVPISRLADCLAETAADIAAHGLIAPIVGHVGDGNFHSIVVLDPADGAMRARLESYLDRLAARAIAMEGTCTGEHGIGQGKARHLAAEAGPAVAAMRRIKAALDPDGLFNPGKMFEG